MDLVTLSDERDWAERKKLEKNERYGMHSYFINYLSALSDPGIAHKPTSQLEHVALSRGSNFKTDSAFLG